MHGRTGAVVAIVAVVAGILPATAGAADWPRRLFPVARAADPQDDAVQDFLERPGGEILIASGSEDSFRGRVRALGLDGRSRTVVEFRRGGGRSGIGLLGDRGSRFLAIDGWGEVVRRVRASGRSDVFAGTGSTGFSGDGGPATAARLRFGASGFLGLARTADGSVVFPDAWNNRLRRVRPDGVIETVAGVGPSTTPSSGCAPFAGDGGPATQATLCGPTDVLATADGLLVSDRLNGRIRRIAPDGTITTIAGDGSRRDPSPADEGKPATDVPLYLPTGLAQLRNGDILFAEPGQIRRLTADGRVHAFLSFTDQFGDDAIQDFTGRQVGFSTAGIVPTSEDGLLIAAGDGYYLAPRHTRRTLVGIRDARVSRGSVTLDVQATRRARATVTVRADGHTVARSTRRIRAGHRTLRVRGPFATRPHTLRVSLRGPRSARAADSVALYLGTRLREAYIRRFSERFEEDGFPDRCRRFTSRRVDCALNFEGDCAEVASYALRRTGVIWRRQYDCTSLAHPFRRSPTYTDAARPIGPREL
jgi:hypothetical protein